MIVDAQYIYNELLTRNHEFLSNMSREHGVYALHDHEGVMRYIGITVNDKYGFYGRIFNRHVTGSEGRSHKFSHAYNTGRMWRTKKDTSDDAKIAKDLRTAFIRKYCRATFFATQSVSQAELSRLEREIQGMAPKENIAWASERDFNPLPEPTHLVDQLIKELNYSAEQRAAIIRQAEESLKR